jgi:hypothetical protein
VPSGHDLPGLVGECFPSVSAAVDDIVEKFELLPFAFPAVARITAAAANALSMISSSILLLLVSVPPAPSVADALERRVKLAVHRAI